MSFEMRRIGVVESCYGEKFGIPRQPGLAKVAWGRVVFDEAFRDPEMVRGLDGFSHVWLIFVFHEAAEKAGRATVRPPRLGGNERKGVFATRAPYRPNSIGMSVVELEGVGEDGSLLVRGVDVVDGTPLLDVKPYVPFCDSVKEARGGFVSGEPERMAVEWDCEVPGDERFRMLVEESLGYDPRPAYQKDEERIYGCLLGGVNVRWCVTEGVIRVLGCLGEK